MGDVPIDFSRALRVPKREELVALCKTMTAAEQAYAALGMSNVYNQTPEQKVDLDLRYFQAQNAVRDARMAYYSALARFTETVKPPEQV